MTVRVTTLVLTLLQASAALVLGQQAPGGTGIIYGPRHVFRVTAPAGWVLDNQAGRSHGLVAVFYRRGESFGDGPAVMYVSTAVPDVGSEARVARVIQDDSARFVREVPGIKVNHAELLRTSDQRAAEVRRFVSDSTFEAVAYVAERTVTPLIVLSARTQAAFQQALPAFEQLVRSYAFISSEVRDTLLAVNSEGADFEQLLALHRQDLARPGGKEYEGRFTAYYQNTFGAVLGECIRRTGPPASFEVIYVISEQGRVTRAVAKVPSALTACVIRAAERDTFPAPPFWPFHQDMTQDFGS
jgi:hypothetical protein